MAIKKENSNANTNEHLESRVGKLEGTMETLAEGLRTTSTNVDKLINQQNLFKEEVLGKLGTLTAPKWPLILSFIMAGLTIFGLVGTVMAFMMSGQRDAIETLKAQIQTAQINELNNKYEDGKTSIIRENITNDLSSLKSSILDVQKWQVLHENEDSKLHGEEIAKLGKLNSDVEKIEQRQYLHNLKK